MSRGKAGVKGTMRPVSGRVGDRAREFVRRLDKADRRSLAGMGAFVVLLHLLGFGVLLGLVVPRHYSLGGNTPIVGVGVLAYTFGLRHAFDADHIAAVDNTTRKLLEDRTVSTASRKPWSVGFWFSLGHSTVVFALAVLLAVGVRTLAGQVEDGSSLLHSVTGIVGASVSGVFLWILGTLNLAVLIGIIAVFRRMRHGGYNEQELEGQLNKRGFMNRFLGGLTKSVTKPWQVYPVGVLFGLGFDTATEVGLLLLAGGVAAFQLPLYVVFVLPLLFAAGMCLMDTVDGVMMNCAYGWAFLKPARKVYYNLVVTALSVAVALIIGTVEILDVLSKEAGVTGGPLAAIADLPLDDAGYLIVALFVAVWVVALAIWKLGGIEERWSAKLPAAPMAPGGGRRLPLRTGSTR